VGDAPFYKEGGGGFIGLKAMETKQSKLGGRWGGREKGHLADWAVET